MNKYIGSNPIFNPNMLLIFVLISVYSQGAIYNLDDELLSRRHPRASNRNVSKARHIGYKEHIYSSGGPPEHEKNSNKISDSYEKKDGHLINSNLDNNLDDSKTINDLDEELSRNSHDGTSNNDDNNTSYINYTEDGYGSGSPSKHEADSNGINDYYEKKDRRLINSNSDNNLDYSRTINDFDEELSRDPHDGASNNDDNNAGDIDYTEDGYGTGSASEHEADSNGINGCCEEKDGDLIDLNPDNNLECGGIINGEVVPEYQSKLLLSDSNCDQVLINVPVVLSRFEIEFPCEAIIKLDYPALDIKRIKENVYLDECRLLPKVNKLFIGGTIRKNIEYSTEHNIRNAAVEIPFKCTTKVGYFIHPIINSDEEQIVIETLRSDGMGTDLTEKTYINSKHFNEKIYCKLISNEISELDKTDEDEGENENPECEKVFETLISKMVVKLNIKLLQEREINIDK